MDEKACKACGTKILFVENSKTGNKLPLQKLRTVYSIDTEGKAVAVKSLKGENVELDLYVSHFETCTHPEMFSR